MPWTARAFAGTPLDAAHLIFPQFFCSYFSAQSVFSPTDRNQSERSAMTIYPAEK
jgi:hypothetical protein